MSSIMSMSGEMIGSWGPNPETYRVDYKHVSLEGDK
jgi:hypothetical protein